MGFAFRIVFLIKYEQKIQLWEASDTPLRKKISVVFFFQQII